jgi:purine-cytosine permease-like protein
MLLIIVTLFKNLYSALLGWAEVWQRSNNRITVTMEITVTMVITVIRVIMVITVLQ